MATEPVLAAIGGVLGIALKRLFYARVVPWLERKDSRISRLLLYRVGRSAERGHVSGLAYQLGKAVGRIRSAGKHGS